MLFALPRRISLVVFQHSCAKFGLASENPCLGTKIECEMPKGPMRMSSDSEGPRLLPVDIIMVRALQV